MSKEVNFLIFCIEEYKSAKNLTGKQVIRLFQKYRVSEYIISCFEALHTTGTSYIIDDIDLYIEARKAS
ncbi:MAG: DUF3791 domain-containing protein [Clostridia bacterium]|nr:DUF3791 domain-containing protein [Clostridia bacterium]